MSSIIIKNVLLDGKRLDIFIKDNRIAKIGTGLDEAAVKVIDGSRMAAVPGFVNMHTHAGMTLHRGIKEDTVLSTWLDEIWKAETLLSDELIYWGTRLACLEMIKTGTTTFNDMYWRLPWAAKAVEDSGIRAVLNYTILDGGDPGKQEVQPKECAEYYELSHSWNPRVQFGVAIHGHYTVCDRNMLWAADFAREHDLQLHTHLSETKSENEQHYSNYGMSPTMRLYNMGILGDNVVAAHSLWLDADDIRMLGEKKVTAVHNPNSNLKLTSGYRFLYNELRDAGVNVTLGTDGCGSSNNLDMLEAMKTASFVQKAWREDPTAMPLHEVMAMATSNGAKALRLDTGVIREGALADICLVNMNQTFFIPDFDFLANLVYAAHSDCIDTVICDGRIVMEGRKVEGEDELMQEAAGHIAKYISDIGKL